MAKAKSRKQRIRKAGDFFDKVMSDPKNQLGRIVRSYPDKPDVGSVDSASSTKKGSISKTTKQLCAAADASWDRVMCDPNNRNGMIIRMYGGHSASDFKPSSKKKQASKTQEVRHGGKAQTARAQKEKEWHERLLEQAAESAERGVEDFERTMDLIHKEHLSSERIARRAEQTMRALRSAQKKS